MNNLIEMSKNQVIKKKLIAMSNLIIENIDKVKKEKMEVHPSLVRLKELEIQKWSAKAETMLEVMKVIENELD